jgi:hypothetical protein
MSDAIESLPMWVIYYDPKDYPGKWVVRRFDISSAEGIVPQTEASVCDSLTEARAAVPLGASWLDRSPGDEPQIKEMWL